MPKIILYLIQNIFCFFFKIVSFAFISIKVEGKNNLSGIKKPLIIASNHTCWADSFLIACSFPLFSSVFPVRYAVLNKIYYPAVFFFWPLGAFPVKKGIGLDKSLWFGLGILKKNGTVGIFPKGSRQWKDKSPTAKRGVAYLAINSGARILPIKIETPVLKMTFFGALFKRYTIKIKIGKSFSLPVKRIINAEDYNGPAQMVMERVNVL